MALTIKDRDVYDTATFQPHKDRAAITLITNDSKPGQLGHVIELYGPELLRLKDMIDTQLRKEDVCIEEDLILSYLFALGWKASNYRTSTQDRHFGKRKLHIATRDEAKWPEDRKKNYENEIFVQSTLIVGCGAHNVLLDAAKEWESRNR